MFGDYCPSCGWRDKYRTRMLCPRCQEPVYAGRGQIVFLIGLVLIVLFLGMFLLILSM